MRYKLKLCALNKLLGGISMTSKKLLILLASLGLILMLAALPFMSACAKKAPEPTGPITLKFGTWQGGGTKNPLTMGQYAYLDELEKRTNGMVKFERYDAGSLAPGPALLEAVETGIADVAGICPPYFPAELPLHQVTVLPGFSVYPYPRAMSSYELYDRVPEVKAELTKHHIKLISIQALKTMGLVTKKPVRTLEDLKGMKLRVLGYQAELLSALGGVPVSMPTADIYEAISKGTIDGHIHDASAVMAFGTYELCKYYTEFNFGNTVFLMAMRQEVFDSLPAQVQKVIEDLIVDGIKVSVQVNARDNKACEDKMRELGIEFIQPTAADEAKVAAATEQVVAKWIAEREAEGLPAQKVVTEMKELIKKYEPLPLWFK